jgi:hypothetical protein
MIDFLASCCERRCTDRERETSKNPGGHGQAGDRREDSHSFATSRTGKRIDVEDTLKQISPGDATVQNPFSPSF